MKKIILSAVASSCILVQAIAATDVTFISIDGMRLMQESKEGQKFADDLQKQIQNYQNYIKATEQELAQMQEDIKNQNAFLSKDALQEKTEKLALRKKELERERADKEEALRMEIQRKQMKLRENQMNVIAKVCEEKGWNFLLDKNTPGLLYAARATEKTDELIKELDRAYEQSSKISTQEAKVDKKEITTVKKQEAKQKTIERA